MCAVLILRLFGYDTHDYSERSRVACVNRKSMYGEEKKRETNEKSFESPDFTQNSVPAIPAMPGHEIATRWDFLGSAVPGTGLEPARDCSHWILNHSTDKLLQKSVRF